MAPPRTQTPQYDEFGFPITGTAAAPGVPGENGVYGPPNSLAGPAQTPAPAPAPAAPTAPTASGQENRIPIPGTDGYMVYVPEVSDYLVFMPMQDTIIGSPTYGQTIMKQSWRSAAGGTNPAESSKNIRVNQDTGLAYVIDNQGNIVRRAPEFDERGAAQPTGSDTTLYLRNGPQGPGTYRVRLSANGDIERVIGLSSAPTAAEKPQLSNAAILRQSLGPLGGQTAPNQQTSTSTVTPSESDITLGRERTIPVSPEIQAAMEEAYGRSPERRNVYAEQLGGTNSAAYNNPATNPALGNPMLGQDVYSYDLFGNRTFAGAHLATPGGGSMYLTPQNMNAFSAAAYGTEPSGNPLKDFQAGASALTDRSLYMEKNPSMTPGEIQSRYSDPPGGFQRQKETAQQEALNQARTLLQPYRPAEDPGVSYPYDPLRGYAEGTEEDNPILAGTRTASRGTAAMDTGPRMLSSGTILRTIDGQQMARPATGGNDIPFDQYNMRNLFERYIKEPWGGQHPSASSILADEFQHYFPIWLRGQGAQFRNMQGGGSWDWNGTDAPVASINGKTYRFAQGTEQGQPIMAGMPRALPMPDTAAPGKPGFTTQGPLAMVDMNTGQTMGVAGESGQEAVHIQPLTSEGMQMRMQGAAQPEQPVTSSLAYLKALARGRDRAIRLALPAGGM